MSHDSLDRPPFDQFLDPDDELLDDDDLLSMLCRLRAYLDGEGVPLDVQRPLWERIERHFAPGGGSAPRRSASTRAAVVAAEP